MARGNAFFAGPGDAFICGVLCSCMGLSSSESSLNISDAFSSCGLRGFFAGVGENKFGGDIAGGGTDTIGEDGGADI